MKKKYFCEVCGQDFDNKKDCNEHEKKCSRVGLLEKRIKELEDRVDILEKYSRIVTTPSPSYPTNPSFPTVPGFPTAPSSPFNPPIWWCTNSTEKIVNYDNGIATDNAQKAKKSDGEPTA